MNQEYLDKYLYGGQSIFDVFQYMPGCDGYTKKQWQPAWVPAQFTFERLNQNTGYPSWAVIRNDYLYSFLTNMQDLYGHSLLVTSGYRNPVHNVAVSATPHRDSRHQWGDGVDLVDVSLLVPNPSNPGHNMLTPDGWNLLKSYAENAGAYGNDDFPESYSDDPSHLHVQLKSW